MYIHTLYIDLASKKGEVLCVFKFVVNIISCIKNESPLDHKHKVLKIYLICKNNY